MDFFLKLTGIHRLNKIQISQELTILRFSSLLTLLIPLLKATLMSAALRDRYLLSWTVCIASVCSDPTSTSPFLFTDTYIITCLALSSSLTSTETRHSSVTLQATCQCPIEHISFNTFFKGKTCIFTISCCYLKSESTFEIVLSHWRAWWTQNIDILNSLS